jgi:RNA polymerase sigma-70 factor (family 1)
MSDQELEELITAIALHNSRESFKRLYQCYYRKLFCVAKSYVKSAEEAEEIVDDAFLNIWARRAELPGIRNLTVYLCTAVRNRSLTAIAKMKVYEHLNLDEVHLGIQDPSAGAEHKLQADDLAKQLNCSVAKLPDQCRLVFKLVKEDAFKYKEVAGLLNISVKTVEYHMGQALKRIWEDLAQANSAVNKVS